VLKKFESIDEPVVTLIRNVCQYSIYMYFKKKRKNKEAGLEVHFLSDFIILLTINTFIH